MFMQIRKSGMLKAALLTAAVAVLTVLVSTQADAAGEKSKILGQKELKTLITSAKTKTDHERIAQHFDAEVAKFKADAASHAETASIYQNSQASYQNGQMFSHCDALTKSLNQAAEEARALAAEHRAMSQTAK